MAEVAVGEEMVATVTAARSKPGSSLARSTTEARCSSVTLSLKLVVSLSYAQVCGGLGGGGGDPGEGMSGTGGGLDGGWGGSEGGGEGGGRLGD
eukprot:857202-Prymnesium_polylepis.1